MSFLKNLRQEGCRLYYNFCFSGMKRTYETPRQVFYDFFSWHFICIYVYWQSFLRVLLMNILIQFNDCIEMVNKMCSQKHKNCEQRNFVNLRGIFNGNNITSNEMLSSDEILFILLSMRYKLFIYFGPLWGIIMLILCFQCLQ